MGLAGSVGMLRQVLTACCQEGAPGHNIEVRAVAPVSAGHIPSRGAGAHCRQPGPEPPLREGVGVDDASSVSEFVDVEDMGREQDTDAATTTNLRARCKISAKRQGLPCTAWLAKLDATNIARCCPGQRPSSQACCGQCSVKLDHQIG